MSRSRDSDFCGLRGSDVCTAVPGQTVLVMMSSVYVIFLCQLHGVDPGPRTFVLTNFRTGIR